MTNKTHSTHFLLGWVITGLLIAVIVLMLWPATKQVQPNHSTRTMGPVSYADAVAHAAAAVVSIQAIRLDTTTSQAPLLTPPENLVRPNQGSGVNGFLQKMAARSFGTVVTNSTILSSGYGI